MKLRTKKKITRNDLFLPVYTLDILLELTDRDILTISKLSSLNIKFITVDRNIIKKSYFIKLIEFLKFYFNNGTHGTEDITLLDLNKGVSLCSTSFNDIEHKDLMLRKNIESFKKSLMRTKKWKGQHTRVIT